MRMKLDPSKGELYSMRHKCYYADFDHFRQYNNINEGLWYEDDEYFERLCKIFQLVYTQNGKAVIDY